MNPIFANDLPFMLADFGQEVVWGSYKTTGILSMATEDQVNDDGFAIVRGETPALQYANTALPGLKRRDVLTHGGTPYRVRHVDLEGDGLHAIAYLERA